MWFAAPSILICLTLINAAAGNPFNAVAFGNRVFEIESITFSNFAETGRIIAAGNVTVINPTRLGTLKQENCVDPVGLGDSIAFDNAQLRFCYEGGPTMLSGVKDDSLILEVFPEDGTEGEFIEIEFLGSDPIIPVNEDDRGARMVEDGEVTIKVGSAFAFFEEDVSEIEDFQIRIDTIPPDIDVVLSDSNGTTIEAETILNFDETITFTPFPRFANCAAGGFSDFINCDDLDSNPFGPNFDDEFTFSIIFGDDSLILGPFTFFYLVQLQTASLIIPNETISVPINEAAGGEVSFDVNVDVISLDVDGDDAERTLDLRFDVVRGAVKMGTRSGFVGIISIVFNCFDFNLNCFVDVSDEGARLNSFLRDNFLFFKFNVNEIENTIVDVTLNKGEEIRRLTFVPVLLEEETEEEPDIDPYIPVDPPFYYFPKDDSLSPAAVGILSALGACMGFTVLVVVIYFVVKSTRGGSRTTVQPEENNYPEIPEARREEEIVVEGVVETPDELKVAQEA